MLINSQPKIRTMDEYDFFFSSGAMFQVSIDKVAGDTIEISEDVVSIVLVPKPSIIDPSVVSLKEERVIFKSHLIALQHRIREVQELTPAQQEEWQRTVKAQSGTIQ